MQLCHLDLGFYLDLCWPGGLRRSFRYRLHDETERSCQPSGNSGFGLPPTLLDFGLAGVTD
jgi:hypothetical protein